MKYIGKMEINEMSSRAAPTARRTAATPVELSRRKMKTLPIKKSKNFNLQTQPRLRETSP